MEFSPTIILSVVLFVLSALFALIGWFASVMHKQAMRKIDSLIDTVSNLGTLKAVHKEKLNTGTREFERIAAHQKDQDLSIHKK